MPTIPLIGSSSGTARKDKGLILGGLFSVAVVSMVVVTMVVELVELVLDVDDLQAKRGNHTTSRGTLWYQ